MSERLKLITYNQDNSRRFRKSTASIRIYRNGQISLSKERRTIQSICDKQFTCIQINNEISEYQFQFRGIQGKPSTYCAWREKPFFNHYCTSKIRKVMTKIEWTNESWNPVIGCTKVSPGCKNCYAERMAYRLAHIESTNGYGEVITKRNGKWNGTLLIQAHQLNKPFIWKKPRMIFVCSMGDLFHPDLPFEFIDQVFDIIQQTPRHTYQILTKRPEIMLRYFHDRNILIPYNNAWLGVSAENQKWLEDRVTYLYFIPAVIRFVSLEPLIGPVILNGKTSLVGYNFLPKLDWVIVGGESGPNARPMHPDWVKSIRDQCQEASVPFFFKQWGEWRPSEDSDMGDISKWLYVRSDSSISEYPLTSHPYDAKELVTHYELMYRAGKKQASHKLDGKEHNEFPKTSRDARTCV